MVVGTNSRDDPYHRHKKRVHTKFNMYVRINNSISTEAGILLIVACNQTPIFYKSERLIMNLAKVHCINHTRYSLLNHDLLPIIALAIGSYTNSSTQWLYTVAYFNIAWAYIMNNITCHDITKTI